MVVNLRKIGIAFTASSEQGVDLVFKRIDPGYSLVSTDFQEYIPHRFVRVEEAELLKAL